MQNIGIMGERQIGIILSDSNDYFAPNDTIDGHFDAGIAEAPRTRRRAFDSTKVLIQTVQTVMDTVADPQFRKQFKGPVNKTEHIEDRLIVMIDETDPQLKKKSEEPELRDHEGERFSTRRARRWVPLITQSHGVLNNAVPSSGSSNW